MALDDPDRTLQDAQPCPIWVSTCQEISCSLLCMSLRCPYLLRPTSMLQSLRFSFGFASRTLLRAFRKVAHGSKTPQPPRLPGQTQSFQQSCIPAALRTGQSHSLLLPPGRHETDSGSGFDSDSTQAQRAVRDLRDCATRCSDFRGAGRNISVTCSALAEHEAWTAQ